MGKPVFVQYSSFAHRLNSQLRPERWQVEHTLTDEDDEEQAQVVQLYVGVRESVAEGGVDYHEQDDTAHRPKRRLPAVQTLSQEPPAHLHSQQLLRLQMLGMGDFSINRFLKCG